MDTDKSPEVIDNIISGKEFHIKMKKLCSNSKEKALEEQACYFCRLSQNDFYEPNLRRYENDIKAFSIEKNNELYDITCPYCGKYKISQDVIEQTWNKPDMRSKLASIAQERKLKGNDGYYLVWKGGKDNHPEDAITEQDSDVLFLRDYPATNEDKSNRTLMNISRIIKEWPFNHIFEINPLQFGLFYLSNLDDLYYYYLGACQDSYGIPSRFSIIETISAKIIEVIDSLIFNSLITKINDIGHALYKITQLGIEKINVLSRPENKTIGRFTFNGIGQGLMYTGSIFTFPVNTCNETTSLPCIPVLNFIYDCGTNSKQDELVNSINNLPPHIDFITLSHLDRDHINGLEIIREKYTAVCNHKKIKVFLPYFDVLTYENVFKAHLIMSGIKDKSEIDKYLRIYKFSPIILNNNNAPSQRSEFDSIYDYYLIKGDVINPKELGIFIKWNFEFYNLDISQNAKWKSKISNLENTITNILNNNNLNDITIEQLSNGSPIRAGYDRCFTAGKKNISSLLLLHYPSTKTFIQTLLAGDVEFDDNLLQRIKDNLHEPYILQVPHHGSQFNWNLMPLSLWQNADKLVFSFGYPKNRNRHPDVKCFIDIINNGYPVNKLRFVYEGDGKTLCPINYEYTVE